MGNKYYKFGGFIQLKKIKGFLESARKMVSASFEAASFCFRHAPLRYTYQVFCEFASALLPFAVLYVWRELINALTQIGLCPEAWYMLIAYIGIVLLQLAIGAIGQYVDRMFCEVVEMEGRSMVYNKLSKLDMGKYDDPKYQDEMSLVWGSPMQPYLFGNILSLIKCIIVAVCAAVGVSKYYPNAAVAIAVLYVPSFILTAVNSAKEYKRYRDEERDNRKSGYYRNILTGRDTAAELRLYGYENIFREKYNSIWKKLRRSHIRINVIRTAWDLLGAAVSSLGLIVTVIFIFSDIQSGACPPGDAAMIIGLVLTMMDTMETVNNSCYFFFIEQAKYTGNFKSFLSLESAMDESGTRTVEGVPSVELRNVSFRYPGKEDYVLKSISFKLNGGEKLALVGVNGAGKTTLTRLLLRFYDPDEGEILINGINAKEYDINSLRRMYGVMFQNNNIYNMTLADNIMLSDTEKNIEEDFHNACRRSGVDSFVGKCTKGYGTEISKAYDSDGYEPSGGERQKIGLARAYYKDSAVMILDEPSSALDAEAEEYIFRQFTNICQDKGAVLISHRLSAVSMADKVALIEGGELLEFGTHAELMTKNGRYSELYRMQADAYREGLDNDED